MQYHDLIGTHTQQDVALDRLFEDVCVYNERVMGPAHVENVTDLACRTALAYHGVSHITIPIDFQSANWQKRSPRNVPGHTSTTVGHGAALPSETDLHKAAEILNAAGKVAILAGQGALDAGVELEHVAEKLGAPIIKALLGKAAVPDDSPSPPAPSACWAPRPSQDAMEECDALLIVGSSSRTSSSCRSRARRRPCKSTSTPAHRAAPPRRGRAHRRLSPDICRRCLPLLDRKTDREFLEKAQAGMRDWQKVMEERATRKDIPMKPQVVAWQLGKQLHNDAIVVSDSGTIATWWARHIPAKRGQMYSLSGTLATMANGLPYAIGAQVAYPNRQVVAFVGDGGFSMLMGEFATAVRYNLPIKVVIITNNALAQIKWEQMVLQGNPEYGVEFSRSTSRHVARGVRWRGFTIEDPDECGSVMEQALHLPGPVVIDAICDPNEPPLPAKIKPEQALRFAEALARGEPYREKIAVTAIGDKVREVV